MEQVIQGMYESIIEIENALKEHQEFIERLESTTTDELTAYKIREFLKQRNIWR